MDGWIENLPGVAPLWCLTAPPDPLAGSLGHFMASIVRYTIMGGWTFLKKGDIKNGGMKVSSNYALVIGLTFKTSKHNQ